jgi:thiamine-phosphate diphosphorylase
MSFIMLKSENMFRSENMLKSENISEVKIDISLLAILDDGVASPHNLIPLAQELQAGGVTLFQYRAKHTPIREMIEIVRALKAVLHVPLTINDRVDVCLAAKADGVHLGQEDMSPLDARMILGEKAIIGLTLKNEYHLTNAPLAALDYAFLGGVFHTTSKNNADRPLGLTEFSRLATLWKARTALPLGAIAGITLENAAAIFAAGAQGIALISALSQSKNPRQTAQDFRKHKP